jgi:hypothetical protein
MAEPTLPGDSAVPLDEREQRILDEIARQFREEDPELVRAASAMPLAGFARRHIKLAALGTLVGLVVMLGTFWINVVAGLVGFVVMVVSATALVTGIRESGRVQREDPSEFSGEGRRIRWPFRR